jgi:hypothetical protein
MSDIRQPTMCGLFKPGHNPHWIQMRKGLEEDEDAPIPACFTEIRNDGTVVVEVSGRELVLWNHEPERMAEAAAARCGAAQYQPRWRLLWIPSNDGRYAFCVARASENHAPCPLLPPVGIAAELLKVAGGFTMPASMTRM